MRNLYSIVLSVFIAPVALAEDFPIFSSPEIRCETMANIMGHQKFTQEDMQNCIAEEKNIKDTAMKKWAASLPDMRDKCASIVSKCPNEEDRNYNNLAICLSGIAPSCPE